MRTRGIFYGLAGLAVITAGCVHREPRERVVVRHREPRVITERAPIIISQRPPPRAVIEAAPPSPGAGYVWSGGHWIWNGNWMWAPGQWIRPPHPRAAWVPGRWVEYRDHTWRYEPGYWR